MSLEIRPITLRAANAYVAQYHRHNIPTNGHKWSLAVYDGDRLCGVAIAGQPVARRLDDGMTIEVRRVCTDGTIETYVMVGSNPHVRNTGYDVLDADGRSCFQMGYDLFIATCNDSEGRDMTATFWTKMKGD